MKKIVIMAMAMMTAGGMHAQQVKYPDTRKDGTVDEYFGVKVADPYRWLEDDRSAETAAWVEAENKVTNDYLRQIPFRDKLLKRLKEVADYQKVGVPSWRYGKWYFSRNDGLQNQSVVYESDTPGGTPRVFLDPNKLSTDGTVALKGIYHSHDGRYAAYAVSRSGSDWQEFYVIDKQTGKLLDDHIEWAKFSGAAWEGDGFYYSSYDSPQNGHAYSNVNEGQKIYYHKIGTPQKDDVLFYQNPAYPKRFYQVEVNDEETLMFMYEDGEQSGNNLYVRDLRQKGSQFIQMTSDMTCRYAPVETMDGKIYILTNYKAPRYRLMVTDLQHPGADSWQELVPETDNVLADAAVIGGQLFLTYSKDASSHIYMHKLTGERVREIKLPSTGSAGIYGRKDRKECFYRFTTFAMPGTIYQYDIDTDTSKLFDRPKVNFKPDDFVTKQVFFHSKDGTRVPMFITHKKGLKLNGQNPVVLYGYGGFNISLPPSFASSMIPFMEAGGVYVQANLRGGSEYGEKWHEAGTKMQKQNVFDDFIAAAEWLIQNRYTNTKKLAIMGGSNGGLLVGACMTQRPDLYAVAIPRVGVMDMLRYHKFTIGWNWASDYGTSEDSKEMFEYLKAYSPLHSLRPGISYPATLVTTADHDDRVVPAHSFKFAATLQACQAGPAPVLIRIDSKAGHGGGKPLSKQLEEYADIFAFILYNMHLKY